MKKILVIGSTAVDVCIRIPHLPNTGEDINIERVENRIGGCAYNAARMLKRFSIPHILCSPVGTGAYGEFVVKRFEKEGIKPFIRLEEENGCCYCLIEKSGERSFLSLHGAEYMFGWLRDVDLPFADIDGVLVCGVDLEDPSGGEIVAFVRAHPELTVFFAPGPRLMSIERERVEAILACSPILHLNRTESFEYTGETDIEKAGSLLSGKTGAALVITLGEHGAYYRERDASAGRIASADPVQVKDTVGAGDAHCGAVIAGLKQGLTLQAAVERANQASGALISDTLVIGKPLP
jgi:sugar/nucleoside kinase (ribokinase family)